MDDVAVLIPFASTCPERQANLACVQDWYSRVLPGVPQIVADDVIAVVRELDALAFSLAAPLALHAAAEDLARQDLQPVELRHELGRKQFFALGFGCRGHGASTGVGWFAVRRVRRRLRLPSGCAR